jgi:hypothetical protein
MTQRLPRPLRRDKDSFRDDRLFILACDDTFAPRQYFGFFALSRVKIHVVPTKDGSSAASHVLQRLLEIEHEEDDERWLLLDTDHYIHGTHLAAFMETLTQARKNGIQVALSRPSFEVWLLLHHLEESSLEPGATAGKIEAALRTELGQYNKSNLKREHHPLSAVCEACLRARRLDKSVIGGEIPAQTTTRVYQLWDSIVSSALPAQLPVELRRLTRS